MKGFEMGSLEDVQMACPEVHRIPQGPNEDMGVCPLCFSPSFAMRPVGESFGWHAEDCASELLHEGYCTPGGSGHVMPEWWHVRG